MVDYRMATIADLTLLLEFVKEFHEGEQLPFDAQADRKALEDLLLNESLGQAWLIQQGHEAIGYILLTLGYSIEYRGKDAFVDEFYLRPAYRRQGIGTMTLAFAEEVCRALGVQALHLEADFENVDAQKLYHKVGYQRHDRFLMTKWLAETVPDSSVDA
ncbi:MAG: GNAT family N-acetyltransferase [Stenomitos rutilans HA7619-LM2]|nr:GNAT family N-acetyltransferase [Stenomitos rutilans HA7619-LM2]